MPAAVGQLHRLSPLQSPFYRVKIAALPLPFLWVDPFGVYHYPLHMPRRFDPHHGSEHRTVIDRSLYNQKFHKRQYNHITVKILA